MPSKFCWTYSAIVDCLCNKKQTVNKDPISTLFLRPPCANSVFVRNTADKCMTLVWCYMKRKMLIKKSKERNDCWRTLVTQPWQLTVTGYFVSRKLHFANSMREFNFSTQQIKVLHAIRKILPLPPETSSFIWIYEHKCHAAHELFWGWQVCSRSFCSFQNGVLPVSRQLGRRITYKSCCKTIHSKSSVFSRKMRLAGTFTTFADLR